MKNFIIYTILLTAVALQGCEDFLQEDFRSGDSTDEFYSTADGLEALVGAAYVTNRIWYGQEEGLDFADVGTDQYTVGPEHPNAETFKYTRAFDSQRGRIIVIYVEFYKGINAANEAISYLSQEDHPLNATTRAKRLAEMRFLRAFYLWHLVEQFGPIEFSVDPTTEPITTASRKPVSAVYQQIFEDVNYAVDNFSDTDNATDTEHGRVNKDAAQAFRARLSLNVASYINSGDEFGLATALETTSADMFAQAKSDADDVIANSRYSFYGDYADLWLLSNNSTSRNSEGIWAVNFSRNLTATMGISDDEYRPYYTGAQKAWDDREGGDVRHLMFGMRYDALPGMKRDVLNGRPFRRYFPLKFFVDLFDDNDVRFDEQFQTVYISNADTLTESGDPIPVADWTFPNWEDFDLPAGFTIPSKYEYTNKDGEIRHHMYRTGDTAVIQYREDIDDSRIAAGLNTSYNIYVDRACLVWDENLLYQMNGPKPYVIDTVGTQERNSFYKLSKFDDPERPAANGTGSQRGIRDPYVFRLSEMYLIAAEAIAVGGVAGDPRSYLDVMANSRAADGNGAALVDANIANSANGTMDIYFFLEERAREFVGEHIRWFDLKRSFNRADWVNYIKERNPDVELLQQFHYFRPIPQIQIDAISNKEDFPQNEGYDTEG